MHLSMSFLIASYNVTSAFGDYKLFYSLTAGSLRQLTFLFCNRQISASQLVLLVAVPTNVPRSEQASRDSTGCLWVRLEEH